MFPRSSVHKKARELLKARADLLSQSPAIPDFANRVVGVENMEAWDDVQGADARVG
jgi:hypothetical protein